MIFDLEKDGDNECIAKLSTVSFDNKGRESYVLDRVRSSFTDRDSSFVHDQKRSGRSWSLDAGKFKQVEQFL